MEDISETMAQQVRVEASKSDVSQFNEFGTVNAYLATTMNPNSLDICLMPKRLAESL